MSIGSVWLTVWIQALTLRASEEWGWRGGAVPGKKNHKRVISWSEPDGAIPLREGRRASFRNPELKERKSGWKWWRGVQLELASCWQITMDYGMAVIWTRVWADLCWNKGTFPPQRQKNFVCVLLLLLTTGLVQFQMTWWSASVGFPQHSGEMEMFQSFLVFSSFSTFLEGLCLCFHQSFSLWPFHIVWLIVVGGSIVHWSQMLLSKVLSCLITIRFRLL